MDGEIKKFDLSNRIYALMTALVIGVIGYLVLDIGIYAISTANSSAEQAEQIVVSGEGEVFVKPDVAIVVIGVKTEASKSDDAVSKNNEKMNAIIGAVKDLKVEDKDIKTFAYNLYPVYDYTEAEGRELTGYSLDQQVTVKVRDFEKISSVLDKATANGANDVSNLQITVDNPETAKAEARKLAIDQAKKKAVEMAKNSGLKLGKVIDVQENFYGGGPIPYGMGGAEMMAKTADSVAPQIQAGEQEIKVTVSLTYRVK